MARRLLQCIQCNALLARNVLQLMAQCECPASSSGLEERASRDAITPDGDVREHIPGSIYE